VVRRFYSVLLAGLVVAAYTAARQPVVHERGPGAAFAEQVAPSGIGEVTRESVRLGRPGDGRSAQAKLPLLLLAVVGDVPALPLPALLSSTGRAGVSCSWSDAAFWAGRSSRGPPGRSSLS
jgi:hypothetical protein